MYNLFLELEIRRKVSLQEDQTKQQRLQIKALLAHCLISSLDKVQGDNVDAAWTSLVEERLAELESGEMQGITRNDIKNK